MVDIKQSKKRMKFSTLEVVKPPTLTQPQRSAVAQPTTTTTREKAVFDKNELRREYWSNVRPEFCRSDIH